MVKFSIRPNESTDSIAVLADLLTVTRDHDGCNHVYLTADQTDPTRIVVIMHWESTEKYEAYFAWRNATRPKDIERLMAVLDGQPDERRLDVLDR